MNVKKTRPLFLVITITILLAGCASSQKPGERAVTTISGVSVETAHFQTQPEIYEAVGTVRSATTSVLGAQIGGTVREIRVKPGDRVRRGQVLALLDGRIPRAQLAVADAGVDEVKYGVAEVDHSLQAAAAERKLAEDTYHRYQQLYDRKSVTRQEFDGVETRYRSAVADEGAVQSKKKQMQARGQQAQSQQESARTVFSYSKIASPIDGIVTAKPVDVGTVVMPGTPIITVEDTAHYRLEASVPQALLSKIRLEQETTVETSAGQWKGTVAEIVPSADPDTRTSVVKVALPQTCKCQSGEYGKARFPVGEQKALTVPQSALLERGQLEAVYAVDPQGIAGYRLVTTGKSIGDRIEILSGLSDGERVATTRLDQLSDGVRVVTQ